jgi:eukaryotic-like serine/threonine-protein kinase
VEASAAARLLGGRYRLSGLLGEGGMARVFDAFDERLERPVAVKILRPQALAQPGMRRRFQREAHIAAQLTHPNVVAILDFGEDSSASYLVMERLPGATLRDEIAGGPLSSDRVMLVVSEILSALATIHRVGVVHRDITPRNILIQDDGHTKLSDFGIAKTGGVGADPDRLDDDMTLAGIVLGTPGYLAPERRSGQPATVQSDLFSVGAIMVEALTGRPAGLGSNRVEQLPQPFRCVARGATATDPGDRFRSATQMLQALWTRPPRPRGATHPKGAVSLAPAATASPLRPSLGRPGTELLSCRPPPRPSGGHSHPRRPRVLLFAAGVTTLVVSLFLLLANGSQPTGPATAGSSHPVRLARQQDSDPERGAIRSLATALATGGFEGDAALAKALNAVAGQPAGAARQAAAQQTLSLAEALLDGGRITSGQCQDVENVLRRTGATVPTTSAATSFSAPPASPARDIDSHDRGQGRGGPGAPEDQGRGGPSPSSPVMARKSAVVFT